MTLQVSDYETADAAFAVDQNGLIVLWNSPAESLFGYPVDIALGQNCWKLLGGKDTYGNKYCGKYCSVRKMAFRHRPANSFKISYKTASGEWKQFAISCVTIFDARGGELLLHICRPTKELVKDRDSLHRTNNLTNCHNGTLTRREIEVLALLADGKSTREIVSVLGISTSTVRNHIHHVLHKLHVHTRLDAVLLGKRLGLI